MSLYESKVALEHLSVLLAKLTSLSELAADTQAFRYDPLEPIRPWIQSMKAAGYEVADYWPVPTRHADRIVADIQLFLDLDVSMITIRMQIDMQRCQEEIRRDNRVSLANLVCFKKAMDWLSDIRDMPDNKDKWDNVNTKLRKLIADTKTGVCVRESVWP